MYILKILRCLWLARCILICCSSVSLWFGCMRCFQFSENYVVFYVCHKSTSVFVSSVGSYCRVVFEVRCSMSGF